MAKITHLGSIGQERDTTPINNRKPLPLRQLKG
jgi:hypothetical protein